MQADHIDSYIVAAGDNLTDIMTGNGLDVVLGNGISVFSSKKNSLCISEGTGTIYSKNASYYWLENNKNIYIPQAGDKILGIIEDRGGDFYKVNIGSFTSAILNRLSFDGATKRNKPELKIGDLIYASVMSYDKNLDTEITCVSSSGIRKDWSSGESIYGELSDGITIRVSQSYAQSLLAPKSQLLMTLGGAIKFEIAIGINGMIWIKADSISETIFIRKIIKQAESIDPEEELTFVQTEIKKLKSKKN